MMTARRNTAISSLILLTMQKKGLERDISDSGVAIEDAKEGIKRLTADLEELAAGIKALDKSVAEATEDRKAQNAEFTELMAQDTAAKELLGVAKNRLNKFYNPKQYVAPSAALVTISAHGRQTDAPPPPPERPGAFKKKTEESNGVIAMLDDLIADLDKEMTVAQAEEKDAQADYEQMMKDSAEKRAADSKTIGEKEGVKADTEAALTKHKEALKSQKKEMMATLEVIQALHGECDWLIQYFDVRKEARTNEIGALTKAKAVLSGADYSLLQESRRVQAGVPAPPCEGITCGEYACPAPFELKQVDGQCCGTCWAPDHVVPLDRHSAVADSPFVVEQDEGAPSTCAGVKCFKLQCKSGQQKGHVSGNCCASCVAR